MHACMQLEEQAKAAKAEYDALQAAASSGRTYDEDVARYEGKLWRAPLTQLEGAIERAVGAGKTPLLLDSTGTADVSFLYRHATVIEAKQLVLQVRAPAKSLRDLHAARWGLRRKLVHAMRWGHTLVVRLSDSAPNFEYYCEPTMFPLALFDRALLPCGKDAAADAIFGKVLRESDLADSGGHLYVPETFSVVVTSTFAPEVYEEHLSASLPNLETHVQPVALFELSEAAREAQGLGTLASSGADTAPVLGMAEAMSSNWGGAKITFAAQSDMD